MTWISPRLSAGLRIFAASMAPSAAPAPMMVCSSSMNSTVSPARWTSFRTFLIRSSKSPRYFVPASIPVRSRETMRLPRKSSGTSPWATLRARPSAMAVLPTPGSPMSTGLFFPRRERIWMTRRISVSLPMTGSSCPFRAMSVRSRLYWSRVRVSFRRGAERPGAAAPTAARPGLGGWAPTPNMARSSE